MNGIKQLRENRLMTQEQIAIATGISVVTISRIENGKVNPSFKTLKLLANILETPAEQMREMIVSSQGKLI